MVLMLVFPFLGGSLTEIISNVIVVKSYPIDLLMAILLVPTVATAKNYQHSAKNYQHSIFASQMWVAEVNFVRSYSNIIVELHFLDN